MSVLLFYCSCKTNEIKTSKTFNFNDLVGWKNASLNTGKKINYSIENGNLKIYTNANTWERPKVKTTSKFSVGTYNWRIFIPEIGTGDMASISAFLYNDDRHELDFEIGYGNQIVRNQLMAQPDDLIVYMTSQANPHQSVQKKIKRGQWYNLSLEINQNQNGLYLVNWKINDVVLANLQLNYGSETSFYIFCSVENLKFIGNHIPQNNNYALFDFVEFKSN
ncbi:hypothetical protein [Flavobacterium sp.]|uniref:hypothetical protein n=1 Tax=Flavobacterium sp. TaxID=239 RepID=UPI0026204058|nr:hypothetical protein [Flavobacterium sp.]